MSIRAALAIVLLVVACFWMLRQPLVGVCLVIILFHLNLRVFGSGLEDIRFQFYATITLLASYFINRGELLKTGTPTQPPMRWLFAFLGICVITSAWAKASSSLAFEDTFEFSKIVLFAWLMTKIIRTEKDMRIVIWVMLASVWYTAFMATYGVQWDWIKETEMGIATGGTGTHMMMFFPLLVIVAIFGARWEKIAAYGIIPFILDFLTVTDDGLRASFVALVTSMVFFLIFVPGHIRKKSIVPFAVTAVVFIFVLAPPGYWEQMATILNPSTEGSAASRAIINQASWQILGDYPWGIGYNNYSLVSLPYIPEENLSNLGIRDAHNSYLKVACEFGVVGFVVWITIFFTAWWYLRKVRKTMAKDQPPAPLQLYALAFELGLIGITLSIYTHNYNDLDTLYWFVAFGCALYNIHLRPQQDATPPSQEPKAPHEIVLEQVLQKKAALPVSATTPMTSIA